MPRRARSPRRAARTSCRPSETPNPKAKGEVAELCFAHRVASLGLVVSKPYGDSAQYDFVVDGAGGLRRVQVRSIAVRHRSAYRLGLRHGTRRQTYNASQIDVLAAYVVPADAWYLIPVDAMAGRTALSLAPHLHHSKCRFELYRECWQVLGAKTDEVQGRNR